MSLFGAPEETVYVGVSAHELNVARKVVDIATTPNPLKAARKAGALVQNEVNLNGGAHAIAEKVVNHQLALARESGHKIS